MGKPIDNIKFPALESYPKGPFSANDMAELRGHPVDILRQMCKRDRISTSGLQRKEQYVQTLIQKGNNTAIKEMRLQSKPAAKRKRVTDSLRQSAASYPKASPQPIKEFLEAEFAVYKGFFFEDSSARSGLSSLRTQEFVSKQVPVGNEDLGPYVTIVGTDREPIISKFPLHIWREYFYEGFEDKIQAFSVTTEWGYMPGQHFLVSKVPTDLYQEVQIIFTLMANAKRDGILLAIPSNQAAEFLGLQQDTAASLPVPNGSLSLEPFFKSNSLSSEFNGLQQDIDASLPIFEGSLSSESPGLQLENPTSLPVTVDSLFSEPPGLQHPSTANLQPTNDLLLFPQSVVAKTFGKSDCHSWVDFSKFGTNVPQVNTSNVQPLDFSIEPVVPYSNEELAASQVPPQDITSVEVPVDQVLNRQTFEDHAPRVSSGSQVLFSDQYFRGIPLFEGVGDKPITAGDFYS
jgi:hypothetical protein